MYASVKAIEPLLRVENVDFVCLQYGIMDKEIEFIKSTGATFIDFEDQAKINLVDDIDDVAALASACDLVIAADTFQGALAASVGVETWSFCDKSNWMMHGTDRLPWLPSMTVYTRKAGDNWDAVFKEMASTMDTIAWMNKISPTIEKEFFDVARRS